MSSRIPHLVWLVGCLTIVGLASPASADDSPTPIQTKLGFNAVIGSQIVGGHGAYSGGFHADAALNVALGEGTRRVMVGAGAMLGLGAITIDDMRADDGEVDLDTFTYGPQAQLGIRFGNSRFVDNRVYLSAALLRVDLHQRVATDPALNPGNGWGTRLAIGGSWMGSYLEGPNSDSGDEADPLAEILFWIAPTQGQLVWEHDVDSNRFGVVFGWGL